MDKAIFINTQFALFFNESLSRPDLLFTDLNRQMGNIFDQPPVIIPPPNLPEFDQVPMVQATSTNGLHSCSLATKKVGYTHFASDREKMFGFPEIKNTFLSHVEKLFTFFTGSREQINRIGFITKFFLDEQNPDIKIANLLMNDFIEIHGGKPRRVGIQYVSEINIGDFLINNNTIIQRGEVDIYETGSKTSKGGILVSRDFNSVPEKVSEYLGRFNVENIKRIIQEGENLFALDKIESQLYG